MDTLIIFLRNPEKGLVKTRLARTMGNDAAYETYLILLEMALEMARQLKHIHIKLYFSNHLPKPEEWPGEGFEKSLQKGTDLGSRMGSAFEDTLAATKKAVLIGTDCPDLSEEIIRMAFSQLDHYDVVIGPARDGGYYLLGLKSPAPFLFTDMPWSTAEVLRLTMERLHERELSTYLLPVLNDIDEEADWKEWLYSKEIE